MNPAQLSIKGRNKNLEGNTRSFMTPHASDVLVAI